MDLNITKLSLGSFLICLLAVGCTPNNHKEKTVKIERHRTDTCNLDIDRGYMLESEISCRSCHVQQDKRNRLDLPTMYEFSRMDSLKLRDFIFISKHKDYFKKDTLLDFRLKIIDSMTNCDKKNLLHYLKQYKGL